MKRGSPRSTLAWGSHLPPRLPSPHLWHGFPPACHLLGFQEGAVTGALKPQGATQPVLVPRLPGASSLIDQLTSGLINVSEHQAILAECCSIRPRTDKREQACACFHPPNWTSCPCPSHFIPLTTHVQRQAPLVLESQHCTCICRVYTVLPSLASSSPTLSRERQG